MKETLQSRADRARIQNVRGEVRAVVYARNHRVELIAVAHALQINLNAISRRAVESPSHKVRLVKASVFNLAQNAKGVAHAALLIERGGDYDFMPATFNLLSQSPKPRAVYAVVVRQ